MIVEPNEQELEDFIGGFYADLRGFIDAAYPWREEHGPLVNFDGAERWVYEVADDISEQVAKNQFDGMHPVPVIYVAIASGNGCAKSTFAAFVVDWIMSTRPDCQVTVTANTGTQLKTKTWKEIEKWTQMCITADWFDIRSETVRHKVRGSKWATNLLTWSLENTQAFAGQHARESTSAYVYDEASHIPEAIHDQADGGLTDGEPMYFLFGNPTNRGGRLFRAVFGDLGGQYIHRAVDSRECQFTNKQKIADWIEERGEDSDWVRAHVKGLPPNADELQYIDNKRVAAARKRKLPETDGSDAKAMSIDFARGGSAFNIIGFRQGHDARSIKRIRIPGDQTRDTTLMVSLISELITSEQPDIVFGDATGIGGPIMDRVRQLHPDVPIVDVVNGGRAPDDLPNKPSKYGNWRAYCYGKMKEWLSTGCIEDDEKVLELQLTGPGFYHNKKDQLMIESKEDMEERGLASPDDADQLAMTFAKPVLAKADKKPRPTGPAPRPVSRGSGRGWMRR